MNDMELLKTVKERGYIKEGYRPLRKKDLRYAIKKDLEVYNDRSVGLVVFDSTHEHVVCKLTLFYNVASLRESLMFKNCILYS